MRKAFIIIITVIILISCSKEWQYLGQVPPGERPEVFAPGIMSGINRIHTYPAISPDGKQILWMIRPPQIMEVNYKKGTWSEPHIFKLLSDRVYIRPGFGLDGKLYVSSAQIPGGYGGLDIWYIDKKSDSIATPVNMGQPINSNKIETGQSFTKNGDIYFTSYVQDKRWDRGIVVSYFKDGKYQSPRPLAENINVPDPDVIDYLSYVSPDGSFLLFSSNRHDPSKESCSIYISFLNEKGVWNDPLNLSHFLNFDQDSRDPALSPDGKYLFFSSGENIYWVRTTVIDKIRELQK